MLGAVGRRPRFETAVAAEYIAKANEETIAMLRQIIGTLHRCIGGHR